MKSIILLGSTGSIGTQALDVVNAHPEDFCIESLAAYGNIDLLEEQIHVYHPKRVAVVNREAAHALRLRLGGTMEVMEGPEGLVSLCEASDAHIALAAIVGMAALPPVLACIRKGMRIALASKEVLVSGGRLVTRMMQERQEIIYPVDSEHSALFQCMQGVPDSTFVNRIILTASGGPFFGKSRADMQQVSVKESLAHPNWSMGRKITIDSASMMNKGLEVIEAHWLFNLNPSRIDVVVHRESIIHSMVELVDHSILAQMGLPDMHIPIQYALTHPQRTASQVKSLDFTKVGALSFYPVDREAFPCLDLAYRALEEGHGRAVVLNAANEVAVEAFLQGKIGFLGIADWVSKAMSVMPDIDEYNLDAILQLDAETRSELQGKLF